MPGPFTCPHCGSHDYVVELTGCEISGGTLQEGYEWEESAGQYNTSGTILVDSESVDNEAATAVCSKCEQDISEAVAKYEESLEAEESADDTSPGAAEA